MPRKGANAFVVMADDSQSLHQGRPRGRPSRGDWVRDRLSKESPWKTRLGQDFDVRNYAFDSHLRAVEGFDALAFDGTGSALDSSLAALARRFQGLPLAGSPDVHRRQPDRPRRPRPGPGLPPIFPVIPPTRGGAQGRRGPRRLGQPDQLRVGPRRRPGRRGGRRLSTARPIVAVVLDEAGKVVERQEAEGRRPTARPLGFRFQFRPEKKGINFYKVVRLRRLGRVEREGKPADRRGPRRASRPWPTTARLVVVDQGGGPYRVLYVGGRPNWEFKFLRRALARTTSRSTSSA